MKGIKYQFKSILRDKMCILSFLLPVIVGIAINFFPEASLSSLSEITFGVVENELSTQVIQWLSENGNVKKFANSMQLESAIIDPTTQMIGIIPHEKNIRALLSGDELSMTKTIAVTLPQLYTNKEIASAAKITVLEDVNHADGLKSLLMVITMMTSMFMGCTFNAMNIIGEKEDGIAFINEVLPMTSMAYMMQKIFLGLVLGIFSTALASCVCMQISTVQILPLILLVLLSTFIAALCGLFVGHIADELMVGIVYLKVIMILFIAPPILFYLIVPVESTLYKLSYLLPSSATFYGLMDLYNGQMQKLWIAIDILALHCLVLLLIFLTSVIPKKNRFPLFLKNK